MSSLNEVQQIYQMLEEINVFVNNINANIATTRIESVHALGELREVEYIFYRITSLMQRMGLPPQIDQAVTAMQRMILTIRMLQTALMFLNMGTPYGFAMAGIGMVGLGISAFSLGDVLAGY